MGTFPAPSSTEVGIWFGTRSVSPAEVARWESRRAAKALRRLGRPVPDGLAERRSALAEAKRAEGRAGMERRFARQIALSDRFTGLLARLSGGRRRLSQVQLFVPGATAEDVISWYLDRMAADDESVFLRVCPDHHLFRTTPDGGQEVWETTGGAPFASRFFFAGLDAASTEVVTPADPSYPVQMAGGARLADGTLIGSIRHQFRNENGGVRASFTVEMPWLIGPALTSAHRWHLACEFIPWIEPAAG